MTIEAFSKANFILTIVSIFVTVIGIILTICSLIQASDAKKYAKKAVLLAERDRFTEIVTIIQRIRDYIVNIQSVINPNTRNKGSSPIAAVNVYGVEIKKIYNDLKKLFPDSQIELLAKSKDFNLLIDSFVNAEKLGDIELSKISIFDNYLDELEKSIKKEQASSAEKLA